MAKLSQIQQAYANPNMRKMLNLIASSEGVKHGYNTLFGNQQFNNLGAHPNVRKAFKQTVLGIISLNSTVFVISHHDHKTWVL